MASLKRGGGSVKCCSGSIDLSFSTSPSLTAGSVLQLFVVFVLLVLAFFVNPRKPSNFGTEPVARNRYSSLSLPFAVTSIVV